jgi:surfactin synthase thioesterase subunit
MEPSEVNGSWLRRFNPEPGQGVRLVLLPHAGGSASYFFAMSKALSPVADVLAIQYPGRQDRLADPCIDNVDGLAAGVFAALEPLTDRPIALFGHSLGASVAFEVARCLEQDGLVPSCLFVSGRRAPAANVDHGTYRLSDDGLLAEMQLLSGTDERVLADQELVRMVLPAIRNDYQAAETYTYRPGPVLGCPIVAMVGDRDPRVPVETVRNWVDYTTGQFELQVFAGGHFYLDTHRAEVIEAVMQRLAPRSPI